MDKLGEHFPEELIEQSIFVEGGAFLKKSHQFRNEPPKHRLFFILNKNPKKDNRIITVHATTKIESRKKVRLANVLVKITATEYNGLKEDSIVDCESYIVWHKSTLQNHIKSGNIEPLKSLPAPLLEQLRRAIGYSKTLAAIDKRLIIYEDKQTS